MISDADFLAVQYAWTLDILKRIDAVLNNDDDNDAKINQIEYLVKMGLKAEKNDD